MALVAMQMSISMTTTMMPIAMTIDGRDDRWRWRPGNALTIVIIVVISATSLNVIAVPRYPRCSLRRPLVLLGPAREQMIVDEFGRGRARLYVGQLRLGVRRDVFERRPLLAHRRKSASMVLVNRPSLSPPPRNP